MAIFHYRMGERVSRSAGQSAVRVAAYQARDRFRDERTGYSYNSLPRERAGIKAASDYIERAGGYDEGRKAALFVGLYAPKEAPDWCRGRENIEQFWSRAELAERRQDAQIAERIIIALPHELTLRQNIWLIQDHVKEFTRQGRVVQVAIHAPEHSGPGAERNIHAHLLVSMRGVDEHGFKATKYEARYRYLHRREYVTELRERWASAANRHLARHRHEVRIDHRTLATQGIDRAPTIHLGPGDSRRERQGVRSAAGEINREISARNAGRERQSLDQAHTERHPEPQQERAAEVVDLDAWRQEIEQDAPRPISLADPSPAPASPAAQKATQAREVARGPDVPPPANTASDGPQRGRQKHDQLEAEIIDPGSSPGQAFEDFDDWRQELEQEPAPAPSTIAQEAPDARPNPAAEQPPNPLYERYKAEREAAWQTRQAALKAVDERFSGLAAEQKRFYARRFVEENTRNPAGDLRRQSLLTLMVQQREARAERRDQAKRARQAAKDAHPTPPSWPEWLRQEASRGDMDAWQALARHRNRQRGETMPDLDMAAATYGYDAARTALWEMSPDDLDRATRLDQVPTVGYYTRPLTIADVAMELSPSYAAAAAQEERIRAEWQAAHEARDRARQELERHSERLVERRQELGVIGRALLDWGVKRDAEMGSAAAAAEAAQKALAEADPRVKELGVQLTRAQSKTRREYDQVRMEAGQVLAERVEQAKLAREVRAERWEEERRFERERALERRQERGRGMSR